MTYSTSSKQKHNLKYRKLSNCDLKDIVPSITNYHLIYNLKDKTFYKITGEYTLYIVPFICSFCIPKFTNIMEDNKYVYVTIIYGIKTGPHTADTLLFNRQKVTFKLHTL